MEMITIQKDIDRPKWPWNLSINVFEYKEYIEWLKECCGHGDVFQRDGIWLSQETEDPIDDEIRYFFWGPGCLQFKYEDDMIAFVLRFCG